MASSKKRKPTSTTASRAKKPVRFVKSSAAAPNKKRTSSSNRSRSVTANARKAAPAPQKTKSRTTTKKASTSRSSSRKATSRRAVASTSSQRVDTGSLPGWRELADSNAVRDQPRIESETWLGAMSTARFVVVILAVATLFTLYVGHVFATQDLLTDVQKLRNEQLALEMTFDKLEGEYHRVTGPEEVFAQARELGLEDRLQEGDPVQLP